MTAVAIVRPSRVALAAPLALAVLFVGTAAAPASQDGRALSPSSHSVAAASPPATRSEQRRAARVRRSLSPGSRHSRPQARTAVYDPRASVTCRIEGNVVPMLWLTINPGATFGARMGETVWYRLWGYDYQRGWVGPTPYKTIVAGNPYDSANSAGALMVSAGRDVAALLETWSASRGYQYDWYPPVGAAASGWYCLF